MLSLNSFKIPLQFCENQKRFKVAKRRQNQCLSNGKKFGMMLTCFGLFICFTEYRIKNLEVKFDAKEVEDSNMGALSKSVKGEYVSLLNRMKRSALENVTPKPPKKKRRSNRKGSKGKMLFLEGRRTNQSYAFHVVAQTTPVQYRAEIHPERTITEWGVVISEGFRSPSDVLGDNGCVKIPASGVYYIYSQVSFSTLVNFEAGMGLFSISQRSGQTDEEHLHAICKQVFPTGVDGISTCSIGTLAKLNKNDCVQVKLSPPDTDFSIYLKETMTFFGGYLV